MNLCIYHKSCADGLAAAVAVSLYFNELHQDCEFMTAQYGDKAPNVTGKDVIIVDFSYSRDVLLVMKEQAKSLVVIDHHKTSQAALAGLDFCHFDMTKSGAVLTWEYLFPNLPLPKLFEYVQDRDLWLWQLPGSREVSAALASHKPFISDWKMFLTDIAVGKLQDDGRAILRYQQQKIDAVVSQPVEMIELAGYTVPCVNATHLISEIGNELAKNNPFAVLYFDTNDKRVFSLRSTDEGVDVAEIAKQFGGGGHRNAAGFTTSKPKVI